MKILIPVIGFGAAGGYRVLSELANHWQSDGHLVDFLVDERSAEPYFPTRAGIRHFDKNGRVLDKTSRNKGGGFSSSGNAFSIYRGMWRALQHIGAGYDIILANHSLTAIPVALVRVGLARKFYYVQAYEPEYYALEKGKKALILKWFSILSYKLPLRQIANAPIYIGYRGVQAKHWIPPGVDETIFYRRPSPPLFGPTQPWTVGVIGRREPSKGTRYALDAFEELARIDPYVRLKVAFGNLPEGWHHDRAEVVIPRNDGELAEYYRSVDILIAPGTVQLGACHYPVLEAMACGTPVVTTGYLPADNDNSWIVPVADSAAITVAALSIKAMTPDAMQRKLDAANNSISAFAWGRISENFLELFKS